MNNTKELKQQIHNLSVDAKQMSQEEIEFELLGLYDRIEAQAQRETAREIFVEVSDMLNEKSYIAEDNVKIILYVAKEGLDKLKQKYLEEKEE